MRFSPDRGAFQRNWPLYVFEGLELALFMISACVFTVWLFHPAYPAPHRFPSAAVRRMFMGIAMGITAILIIHSPFGKRSGAHFNPAITLTYLRLGKIGLSDAAFYVIFQFLGGVFGVGVSAVLLGPSIAAPSVDYAVTVPGLYGTVGAFCAELFMATLLMAVVLWSSNRPSIARYTSYFVGILISLYILFSRRSPDSASTRRVRSDRRCLPACGRRSGYTSPRLYWECLAPRNFTCAVMARTESSAQSFIPIRNTHARSSANIRSTGIRQEGSF